MAEFFGRQFNNISQHNLEDLQTLEREGCIYSQLWRDDLEKFGFCRIEFKPDEIVKYIDAMSAYDEFHKYVQQGDEKGIALDKISNEDLKSRVREYNQWTREIGQPDTQFCLAAFLGEQLESVVCGSEEHRYEFIQESYTGDRRYLLSELIEGFHQSVSILQNRNGDRPDFEITCEQDFQDLFYAVIKPIFPDARPEEYTPKHATNSKRIDFVIPGISTVIETKYVRNESHWKNIPDELRVDIETYHTHTDCKQMYALVWDGESYITDTHNFEKDLTGPRTINGAEFQVEVRVIP